MTVVPSKPSNRRDLRGDVGVGRVIPADRDDGRRVAVETPQVVRGDAEGFAHRIPHRGANAGARDKPQPAVAEDVPGRRPGQFPQTLGREGVFADDERRAFAVDDVVDIVQPRVLVAGVPLADPGRGANTRDDRRPVRHAVVTTLVHTVERHPNRDRFDLRDAKTRKRRQSSFITHVDPISSRWKRFDSIRGKVVVNDRPGGPCAPQAVSPSVPPGPVPAPRDPSGEENR